MWWSVWEGQEQLDRLISPRWPQTAAGPCSRWWWRSAASGESAGRAETAPSGGPQPSLTGPPDASLLSLHPHPPSPEYAVVLRVILCNLTEKVSCVFMYYLLQLHKVHMMHYYLSLHSSHLPFGWACIWDSLGRRAAAGAPTQREGQSNQAWGSSLDVKKKKKNT